jgi:hypothetical protein
VAPPFAGISRRVKRGRSLNGRRWLAVACVAVGLILTVALGVWAAGSKPPNGAQSALLVVLSGLFQLGAANYFYRAGRADPPFVRQVVRQLSALVARARSAERLAELTFDSGTGAQMKQTVGRLSVELSYLREGLELTIPAWQEVNPSVLDDLAEGGNGEPN